jgi:D-glycerate 3-kinase
MSDEPKEGFRGQFQDMALARGIDDSYYYDALLKIVERVVEKRAELAPSPVTVGIGGAQGSGKSTLAELLAAVLENVAGLSATVLSLDDFYKTRNQREEMARSVHPLFAVRGVPGTHDMDLMNGVIDGLKTGISVESPVFNKAEDDRSEVSRRIQAVDVIVLEGWCWGSVPQPAMELEEPVNELEQSSDVNGRWRRTVNDELASFDYQHAFDNDLMIFLAVPDMEAVYRWRLQQEQGLAGGTRVMNESEIREFIMYYERLTRAMLAEMPDRADITLFLNEAHLIMPGPLHALD